MEATILILGKDISGSERFLKLLEGEGMTVYTKNTTGQVSRQAHEGKVDLIIVNIDQSHALNVCRNLRSAVETCFTAILLLLDEINEEIIKTTKEIGVEEVAIANISDDEFIKIIKELLAFKNKKSN